MKVVLHSISRQFVLSALTAITISATPNMVLAQSKSVTHETLIQEIVTSSELSLREENGRRFVQDALEKAVLLLGNAEKELIMDSRSQLTLLKLASGELRFRYFGKKDSEHYSRELERVGRDLLLKNAPFLRAEFFVALEEIFTGEKASQSRLVENSRELLKSLATQRPSHALQATLSTIETHYLEKQPKPEIANEVQKLKESTHELDLQIEELSTIGLRARLVWGTKEDAERARALTKTIEANRTAITSTAAQLQLLDIHSGKVEFWLIVEFRGENDSIFLMKRRLEEALIGID